MKNNIFNIDQNKINKILEKGYLSIDDDYSFKYIVEILRLFGINAKMWMKGSYILNDNEGIMFSRNSSKEWSDEIDDNYFYEIYKSCEHIDKVNEYWGTKTIYIFRKEKDTYKFIGVYQQDFKKIDELFAKGIYNKRPYKRIRNNLKLV